MALAFQAALTAIYVKPVRDGDLSETDRVRLQNNMRLAERRGAEVVTVSGSDIAAQIAGYARLSGVSKIVVGRSGAKRQHFWSKAPLTEQIILNAPDVDVYIIPDSTAELKQRSRTLSSSGHIRPTLKDTLLTVLILTVFTGIGFLFTYFGFSESNIITVFILGVLIIAVVTASPLYSVAGSLFSVLLFNWFFIEPKFSFQTYKPEYAVTFVIMLISSLITGALANRLKDSAKQSSRDAFRAKVLFDTNQLLQKADRESDVIRIAAQQITTLLDRGVVFFPAAENSGETLRWTAEHAAPDAHDADEEEIARWVYHEQLPAGAHTDHFPQARSLYHPVSINGSCFGVLEICLGGERLEAFDNSVFTSILGECELALEGLRNAAEKEQAAIAVRNEQLRSNLLRSISHDIRTPLTSILGNASNLLSHYEQLDRETLRQTFSDIYDDSEWLIDLVENLLSLSRIENGQMELHPTLEVVGDVIEEAMKHIDRNAVRHRVTADDSADVLIARMDARLIMQVLINLINNAVKNTPDCSEIRVFAKREGQWVLVSVEDNGPGIADDVKPHIFEMFYTGPGSVSDGRRGLGLGLALCRSIVEAHGGSIVLEDNRPSGCRFTFSLPAQEVPFDE